MDLPTDNQLAILHYFGIPAAGMTREDATAQIANILDDPDSLASWESYKSTQPASVRQIARLRFLGIRPPAGLTKTRASELISELTDADDDRELAWIHYKADHGEEITAPDAIPIGLAKQYLAEIRGETTTAIEPPPIPTPAVPPPPILTAERKRKTESTSGAIICFLLGIGISVVTFPIGLIIGIPLALCGLMTKTSYSCTHCGNALEKTSKLCPSCRATIAGNKTPPLGVIITLILIITAAIAIIATAD